MRGFGILLCSILGRRNDADMLAVLGALGLKHDLSVNQCEKGVVLAAAHVDPIADTGPPLTDDDAPRTDFLATIDLHTQAL